MSEQTTQTQNTAPKKQFNRPAGASTGGFKPRTGGAGAKPGAFPQKRRIVRGAKTQDGKPTGSREGGRKTFAERPRSEFEQKMIDLRRVTRVVSGGRRMSFAVALVIGDKKGRVGLGTGKGQDTAIAIAKALKQAKKNLITIKLTKENSLPYEISAKYNASRVVMRPNRAKGMVAGSSLRDILTLAGAQNVTAKINSASKNKLGNARAAIKALETVATHTPVFSAGSSESFSA